MRSHATVINGNQPQASTGNDSQQESTTDNSGNRAPLFYTVPDAARLMQTAPVTLYRAIRNGEFPAMRIGRRVVVPAKAIEAMVDAAVAEQNVVAAAAFQVVRR